MPRRTHVLPAARESDLPGTTTCGTSEGNGGVVHSSSIEVVADGAVIQQREVAYGRLDVYDPGAVPDSVFAKISSMEEPCYVPH